MISRARVVLTNTGPGPSSLIVFLFSPSVSWFFPLDAHRLWIFYTSIRCVSSHHFRGLSVRPSVRPSVGPSVILSEGSISSSKLAQPCNHAIVLSCNKCRQSNRPYLWLNGPCYARPCISTDGGTSPGEKLLFTRHNAKTCQLVQWIRSAVRPAAFLPVSLQ